MQVSSVMTRNVECMDPHDSLCMAARKMRDLNVGPMPVCENGRVIGIVTDRDIAIRAVAEERDPQMTSVSEIMSTNICSCFEDQEISEAATLMEDRQIRRLIVLDHNNELAGIVSLGDLAVKTGDDEQSGEILERISEPVYSQ